MFVLLEHTQPAETAADTNIHWDFLVEVAGLELLPTWRLAANPLVSKGSILAERIQDHRRHFLTYEGELSAGLGSVSRVAHGEADIISYDNETVLVELAGTPLAGMCEIVRSAGGVLVWRRRG